jgi:hypothetical protein
MNTALIRAASGDSPMMRPDKPEDIPTYVYIYLYIFIYICIRINCLCMYIYIYMNTALINAASGDSPLIRPDKPEDIPT